MFERLTDRTGNSQVYLVEGPEEDMYGYYTGKGLKQIENAIDRLAAYEDSGLSPEQVQEQQGYIKTLETTDKGEQARRIIELEEALKKIANPILYMKKEAKEAKGVLDGVMALNLIKEPSYYREIAEKALLGGPGMNEIEKAIAVYEDNITQMELNPDAYGDDLPRFKLVLTALREQAKLTKAKAEGRLVVLPCKVGELMGKYRELTESEGADEAETYTTGYRNGHRNGQTELLAYLLQIDTGCREAAERAMAEAKRAAEESFAEAFCDFCESNANREFERQMREGWEE